MTANKNDANRERRQDFLLVGQTQLNRGGEWNSKGGHKS